jgi:hypothetical protein
MGTAPQSPLWCAASSSPLARSTAYASPHRVLTFR